MKSLTVELPDRLAQELEAMVKDGWVSTEEEAVRIALWEFVRRSPRQLAEQYQLDDIAWAMEAKGSTE